MIFSTCPTNPTCEIFILFSLLGDSDSYLFLNLPVKKVSIHRKQGSPGRGMRKKTVWLYGSVQLHNNGNNTQA
jgi:hypothetical protein